MDEEETEMFESVRMENGSGKLFFFVLRRGVFFGQGNYDAQLRATCTATGL
jgi:hypothetical protein